MLQTRFFVFFYPNYILGIPESTWVRVPAKFNIIGYSYRYVKYEASDAEEACNIVIAACVISAPFVVVVQLLGYTAVLGTITGCHSLEE